VAALHSNFIGLKREEKNARTLEATHANSSGVVSELYRRMLAIVRREFAAQRCPFGVVSG
jgi:hypothetical protein